MANILTKLQSTDLYGQVKGIPTGLATLDQEIGGLQGGHLYVLVAETGMGKSIMGINIHVSLAKAGISSCYIDLENGAKATLKRFAMIYGLKDKFFFTQENKDKAQKIYEELDPFVTYYDQQELSPIIGSTTGIAAAKKVAELIKAEHAKGSKFFTIDPLGMLEPVKTGEHNETGNIVNIFKNLSQELNVPILIQHHLSKPNDRKSKKVEDVHETAPAVYRIPTIHDVIGTSKITNTATDVWAMVRQKDDPDRANKSKVLLKILKAREGVERTDYPLVMNLDNLKITEPASLYEEVKQIFYED